MIDFISQVLHLRFGNAIFEHTVEIVICAVVVSSIGTKIAILIYIPFGIVGVGIQTISDVAGGDVLVAHHSAVPSANVANDNDWLGKLNIQVDSLIGEVVVIRFLHPLIECLLIIRVVVQFISFKELLVVLSPVVHIKVLVAPNDVAVIRSCRLAHLFHLPSMRKDDSLRPAPEAR